MRHRHRWSRREQVLGGVEGLLHGPQLFVAEHGLERVQIGSACSRSFTGPAPAIYRADPLTSPARPWRS